MVETDVPDSNKQAFGKAVDVLAGNPVIQAGQQEITDAMRKQGIAGINAVLADSSSTTLPEMTTPSDGKSGESAHNTAAEIIDSPFQKWINGLSPENLAVYTAMDDAARARGTSLPAILGGFDQASQEWRESHGWRRVAVGAHQAEMPVTPMDALLKRYDQFLREDQGTATPPQDLDRSWRSIAESSQADDTALRRESRLRLQEMFRQKESQEQILKQLLSGNDADVLKAAEGIRTLLAEKNPTLAAMIAADTAMVHLSPEGIRNFFLPDGPGENLKRLFDSTIQASKPSGEETTGNH